MGSKKFDSYCIYITFLGKKKKLITGLARK